MKKQIVNVQKVIGVYIKLKIGVNSRKCQKQDEKFAQRRNSVIFWNHFSDLKA